MKSEGTFWIDDIFMTSKYWSYQPDTWLPKLFIRPNCISVLMLSLVLQEEMLELRQCCKCGLCFCRIIPLQKPVRKRSGTEPRHHQGWIHLFSFIPDPCIILGNEWKGSGYFKATISPVSVTFSKTVQCSRCSNFPFKTFTGKQMTRPDEYNPLNNFPTQSQVIFHCLKKHLKEGKIFWGSFSLVTSSEELFLCQRLSILSFMLIGWLAARMGSKGNSHHKFIGGKVAPGMSFWRWAMAMLIL